MPPLTHLIFLALLALTLFTLGCCRTRGRGWRGLGLPFFFALLFAGLLLHQACWQLSGFGSLGFQKFQRRYDLRPTTLERTANRRGRLLDRNGLVLSQPKPGTRWGHEAPLGEAGLHPIGYSSRDYGLGGLLRVFDARLCGLPPPGEKLDLLQRRAPEDVTLTLDSRLQQLAYEALEGRPGAVVILDPRNGEILALASAPAVREEHLGEAMRSRAKAPLLNRATHGLYPPGSVFKLFTAALALDCGKAGSYACPPKGWAPGAYTKPIRDTHPRPAEDPMLDRRTAFAESSNIWFAKAAVACTWPRFQAAAERVGLADPLLLARCGERTLATAPGSLPDLSAAPNRVAYLGFGQGKLLLTPLHIAALTASIARDGLLFPPHLERTAPPAPKRLWSAPVANEVKALMRVSVTSGTSRGAALPKVAVCGKTGTAETSGKDHAWFTCFAPADKPRVVVTVLVEHGGFGAATALPIAKRLLREALERNN